MLRIRLPRFTPNIFYIWTNVSHYRPELVWMKYISRQWQNKRPLSKILTSFYQDRASRVAAANSRPQSLNCTFGNNVTLTRSFSKWRPYKKNKYFSSGERDSSGKLDASRTRKGERKAEFQSSLRILRKNLNEAYSSQGRFYEPQINERLQNLEDKVKWYAQSYQDCADSVSINESRRRVWHQTAIKQSSESSGSDSDSDEEQENGREMNNSVKTKIHETYPNKTRSHAYKEGLQKTRSGAPRPSRYHFSEVTSGEEQQRWLRRSSHIIRPKSKSEWYARQMLKLTDDNEIDRALELFDRMKSDRIRPTIEVFNILISALGRTRMIRRAFNFYNDMKKYGLSASSHTYSSLFNACAESPVPKHALDRAEKLWSEVASRVSNGELELNIITCNSAMKAFAICGNPNTSFSIYDVMLQQDLLPDTHTYAMLLTACGFDAEDGASKALCILDEMNAHGVKPDIYNFNHVLKAIRDSLALKQKNGRKKNYSKRSAGDHDKDLRQDALQQSVAPTTVLLSKHSSSSKLTEKSPLVTSKVPKGDFETLKNQRNEQQNDMKIDLRTRDTPGKTETSLNVGKCETDHFPDTEKFLQRMAMDEVTPDIRTFHLLLQLAKLGDSEEEEYQLKMMKTFGIVPDEVFLNTLIKRRAVNSKLSEAKELLMLMQREYPGLKPSVRTYQSLAVGCKRRKDGLKLLNEMKEQGFSPNTALYGTLIWTAARNQNYSCLTELLKQMSKDSVEPNQRIITLLDEAAAAKVVSKSSGQLLAASQKRLEITYREQQGFRGYYKLWTRKWVAISSKQNTEEQDYIVKFGSDDDYSLDYSHL